MTKPSRTPHAASWAAGSDYLDSASSAPLHPAAREALLAALDRGYADPRRLHGPGRNARLLLDNARAVVAECLGVRPDEISFTSSGTDAIHRGLLGLHLARNRIGTAIAHSTIEHSAVFEAARWAGRISSSSGSPGAKTVSLAVDRHGVVASESVLKAVGDPEVPLAVAAVQLANPEVGVVQPITELARVFGDVPLFMDACAATGAIPWPGGWDAAAASAHKWGGPAGLGLLVIRKGSRWRNPYPADDRIDPRVSGFENIPAALAAAAALRAVIGEQVATSARHRALGRQLHASIADIEDIELISAADAGLPQLVAFSCLYVDGETLVTALDERGFGVASGSACTSSRLSPSHVLEAMGLLTHGNIRVSFGLDTRSEHVEAFSRALREVVWEMRNKVGLAR